MSKYGLVIAQDGQPIRDAGNKVDSRYPTLIVDLEADPKHMQIIETSGGNSYTDSGGSGRTQDLLGEVEHNLGYAPLVDAFFYVISVNGNTAAVQAGGYASNVYFLSGSAGTIADTVTFEADKKYIRFVHNFDKYDNTTGYISPANLYRFRTKFYIYSIDIGRDVNYGYGFDGTGKVIR